MGKKLKDTLEIYGRRRREGRPHDSAHAVHLTAELAEATYRITSETDALSHEAFSRGF